MNTNQLKKFAQAARVKLIEQITAKLDYVLTHDTAELRGRADTVNRLKEEIKVIGKPALIDKVAYTWFNRFIALRFMDANGFQPLGYNVVTAQPNQVSPQILDEAHAGHISEELVVDKQAVMDLLDGRVPSGNPDNDAYRLLLVASCNHVSSILPFLFERINDYTELLLPDDLTSNFSIVKDVVDGMSDEDCKEVEIIGWLYQFYISQRKDEVFANEGKVEKEDIPAATQLFTPRWIVEYMVQNTLGKLWLQNKPGSRLKEYMPFYIESPSCHSNDYLKISSVEEIKMLDQACGSGHILVYGFELLTKIYEEEGYNSSDIPQLIIEKNLYGFEIDERAAQLAGMALMMKARGYYRRFFKKEIKPNILCFKDLKLKEEEIADTFKQVGVKLTDDLKRELNNMIQATNFGSLIRPKVNKEDLDKALEVFTGKIATADLFLKHKIVDVIASLKQLILLGSSYHCVVDNPPYMGGGNMNKELSDFVRKNYPDGKADLMACFMDAGLAALLPNGFLGMINQHTWMFLGSYENLRKKLIDSVQFDTMLHLGARTFPEIGGEVVQNTAFVFKKNTPNKSGVFIRLVNLDTSREKEINAIEAIKNKDCGWCFISDQSHFSKIDGCPAAYWVGNKLLSIFENTCLGQTCPPRAGLTTGNNEKYLRYNFEVDNNQINKKWFRHTKGGGYRKWFGNNHYLVNWENDGSAIKKQHNSVIRNSSYYFNFGFSWSDVGSNLPSFRFQSDEFLPNARGPMIYSRDLSLLGYLNSKITVEVLKILNPTIVFNVGDIAKIPVIELDQNEREKISDLVGRLIENYKRDENRSETSIDFHLCPLISKSDFVDSFNTYLENLYLDLKQAISLEEKVNSFFIEKYNLQSLLSNKITADEFQYQIDLLNKAFYFSSRSNNNLAEIYNYAEIADQFASYIVGCMFGRYSLDKEGLILASQGETIEDYLQRVGKQIGELSFVPDEDNIIPILDDEWFEDDIVNRFQEFLKASFGEKNFRKNLAFVEECLGKDIRKYFTKDFYRDHVQRFKKRPIYWMFSSPKGYFNVLVYMHRYTPDTLNIILNSYLREFIEKLELQRKQMLNQEASGSATEQNKARKQIDKIDAMLADCRQDEVEILYPLASERIEIDLDDGVLVNYNKFGKAIALVDGLNDAKTKKKVREFDWIDTTKIK